MSGRIFARLRLVAVLVIMFSLPVAVYLSATTRADVNDPIGNPDCSRQVCEDEVIDLCPNVDGIQEEIPPGAYVNEKGLCVDQNPNETTAGINETQVLGSSTEVLGK